MWSRGILKSNAKASLKQYYWYGLLVCVISLILGGGYSGAVPNFSAAFGGSRSTGGNASDHVSQLSGPEIASLLLVVFGIFMIVLVVSTILAIFVGNIITVGKYNFFLTSRRLNQAAGLGRVFFGFSDGHYLNIMVTMFLKGLYETLWSLLLIVPGVIKHYEYYMVPYLLAEYPDMNRKEAFQRSKAMMNGNKLETWILELSFMGWLLLGSLLCGVGVVFVLPYMEATFVELYLHLKEATFVGQAEQTVYEGGAKSLY